MAYIYIHIYINTYIYMYTALAQICTPLIVSRSLRSLANYIGAEKGPIRSLRRGGLYYKYSTLPRGISINIAVKVGIFPEAEGRGK